MLKTVFFIFGVIISQFHCQNAVGVPNLPSVEVIGVNQTARISCYNDYGTTASGEITRKGIVATSDYSIKMGTKVYIEGMGIMEIKDRTADWIGKRFGIITFDIYDPKCDLKFGVKKLTYKLIK